MHQKVRRGFPLPCVLVALKGRFSMLDILAGKFRVRFRIVIVNHVVPALFQLRLNEEAQPVRIPAVRAVNHDLLEPVAADFIQCRLQQIPDELRRVGDGAGRVFGFVNLAEIIFRKNHYVFFLRGCLAAKLRTEQVGADRHVRAVLFQHSDRQQASIL